MIKTKAYPISFDFVYLLIYKLSSKHEILSSLPMDKWYFQSFIKTQGKYQKVLPMTNNNVQKYVLSKDDTIHLQLLSLFLET